MTEHSGTIVTAGLHLLLRYEHTVNKLVIYLFFIRPVSCDAASRDSLWFPFDTCSTTPSLHRGLMQPLAAPGLVFFSLRLGLIRAAVESLCDATGHTLDSTCVYKTFRCVFTSPIYIYFSPSALFLLLHNPASLPHPVLRTI